jgi:hypothetical protein
LDSELASSGTILVTVRNRYVCRHRECIQPYTKPVERGSQSTDTVSKNCVLCRRKRFPPPPDTWWGILVVGVRQLRGFGGCNDLIFRWDLAASAKHFAFAMTKTSCAYLHGTLGLRHVIGGQKHCVVDAGCCIKGLIHVKSLPCCAPVHLLRHWTA